MRRYLQVLPFTLAGLLLAGIVCVAFYASLPGGGRDLIPPALRFLFYPGGTLFFVAGTFSGSLPVAGAAFVAGTVAVYGGIGLAADAAHWLLRRGRRGALQRGKGGGTS